MRVCGDGVGLVVREPADDLGEGEVGQGAVGEVEAVPGDDLPAQRAGLVAQLGEHAGLADSGVAGEQERSGRTVLDPPDVRMPSRRHTCSSSASRPTSVGLRGGVTSP